MKHIINYLYLIVLLFASEIIFSDEIEEVIIKSDYRQTALDNEDSSVFILNAEAVSYTHLTLPTIYSV